MVQELVRVRLPRRARGDRKRQRGRGTPGRRRRAEGRDAARRRAGGRPARRFGQVPARQLPGLQGLRGPAQREAPRRGAGDDRPRRPRRPSGPERGHAARAPRPPGPHGRRPRCGCRHGEDRAGRGAGGGRDHDRRRGHEGRGGGHDTPPRRQGTRADRQRAPEREGRPRAHPSARFGDATALHNAGVANVPPNYDPRGREWGTGRRADGTIVLIEGGPQGVDWEVFIAQGGHPLSHSHPMTTGREMKAPGKTLSELIPGTSVGNPDAIHVLPSVEDFIFCFENGLEVHDVHTPYVHQGGGESATSTPRTPSRASRSRSSGRRTSATRLSGPCCGACSSRTTRTGTSSGCSRSTWSRTRGSTGSGSNCRTG